MLVSASARRRGLRTAAGQPWDLQEGPDRAGRILHGRGGAFKSKSAKHVKSAKHARGSTARLSHTQTPRPSRAKAAYETARLVESRWAELIEGKSEQEKMACVIDLRLQQLEPYVSNWAQAMALGAHPRNAATTARNLALLADEMCHTAGLDHGLDHGAGEAARWYTDRAVVAAVYGAAEVSALKG